MERWSGVPVKPWTRILSLGVILAVVLSTGRPLFAGPAQLLSTRDAALPVPVSGNGDSVAPQISPDGRFVLFSSSASDLVPNDNGQLGLDVFLRDCASNANVLVSANFEGTGGGNGNSTFGVMSTNGRYVAFQSDATDLVPGDTNGVSDVFVRDTVSHTTMLVSVAAGGGPANGASSDAAMTPAGRYVAFVSAATNLVAGDTNGIPDVFVRDLVAGTTTLASVGAWGGSPSPPLITPNGRYVVFSSYARGLAPGIPTNTLGEVYVRDLVASRTIWASTNVAALATNMLNASAMVGCVQPIISDDGRYVAFKAWATTNYRNPLITVLIRFDSLTGMTSLVSTNGVIPATLQSTYIPEYGQNDDVYGPEMSPDGRFITYAATKGGTNTAVIQQWDANTGTNTLVSADVNGNVPTNSLSEAATVSPDGRFVTFLSNASNLVTNSVSSGFHVYLRDIQAGVTQLLDANTNGIGATDDWGTVPVLSSDGRLVAFSSLDGSLVGADENNAYDVFLRDTTGGMTELISQRSSGAVSLAGNALSSMGPYSISGDGTRVVFSSYASDLVTNDFNNECDVFVRDLTTGSNILVSVGMDGNAALGGNSVTPVISANGRYVAFVSLATNLVANDTNGAADVFLRDLQAGTTTLVSVNSDGSSLGTGGAFAPVVSADGRYVAFLFSTTPSTSSAVFWRDTVGASTRMLGTSGPAAPSISSDGQRVAYCNNFSDAFVWDVQLGDNIAGFGAVTSCAISPDGNRLFYETSAMQLFMRDLAGKTNISIAPSSAVIQSSAQCSGDGRYFAFVTSSSLMAGDVNNTNDVYLYNLQTGTMTLVSANYSGTGSANGPSDCPAMSTDGRFVVFRSFATDVLTNVTTTPSLFAFDRLTGTTSLLTPGTPGTSWSSWVSYPTISSNATVAFLSWDSSLVGGDLNRVGDVFSQAVTAPSLADSDGDGIPDWWMIQYFGHATGEAADKSRAGDDADGDGMSNLEEYLAGTSPTDFNSVLKVQMTEDLSNTNVLLTWPASAGRNYRVQYKNNLNDPIWLDTAGNVTVIGNEGRFTVSGDSSTRYFRVSVVQ